MIKSTYSLRDLIKIFSITVIFAAILSSVTLLNEFPLVFSDSGTYLLFAVKEGVPEDRPVFYSWLIAIFTLSSKLPIVSMIVSQALIASIVILITLNCLKVTKPAYQLIVAMFLAVSTSLPWFIGQLMPDYLLSIGLLSAYILVCKYYSLNNFKTIFLLTIFVGTSLVHYSNTPILLSTLLIFVLLISIIRINDKAVRRSIITRAVVLIFLTLITLTANHFYTKAYELQLPTVHFLVNRLTDDGIIQMLLDEHCTDNNYILCPYKDDVKPSYLWSGNKSPFRLIGGNRSPSKESWKMIVDAIKYYPMDNFLSAAKVSIKQLFSFNTGDGLNPYDQKTPINIIINQYYPSEYIDFTTSKQQQGKLEKPLSFIKPIHILVVGSSFLVLLYSLVRREKANDATLILTILVLSATISNAAVCGIFSGAYDRYQSRIIWLIPFVAIIIFLRWHDSKTSESAAKPINQIVQRR